MTASVQYWPLPDEEAKMVKYLRSTGSIMALPVRRVAKPEDLEARRRGAARVIRCLVPNYTGRVRVADAAAPRRRRLYGERHEDAGAGVLARTARHTAAPLIHCAQRRLGGQARRLRAVGKKVMQWVRTTAPGWHKYKQHRITAKADAAREAGMEMSF
jgi:hypothetical protein